MWAQEISLNRYYIVLNELFKSLQSFLDPNRNSKTNYYWPLLLTIIRIILLQYHTYCLSHIRAFCRVQILTTNFIVVLVHVLKKKYNRSPKCHTIVGVIRIQYGKNLIFSARQSHNECKICNDSCCKKRYYTWRYRCSETTFVLCFYSNSLSFLNK